MDILIRNAEGNLSNEDREYAVKKLGKLDRYFHVATKVEIVHRQEKQSHRPAHRVEVTVHADGLFLRGEDHDVSIHAAIDKVSDRMETRLKKLKHKLASAYRTRGKAVPPALEETSDYMEEDRSPVVERKRFVMKPMGLEEAILQMELSGHPFFMFRNEHGASELLYKRESGGYGLLSPDM
ncbi:MAG: ribosome-associated translation inhibitor RaiA [Chthonomonadaceae bacterium]|nr:ribosome-associated translation inhibitor RaiA [Chthonomonadaceae bacterium]